MTIKQSDLVIFAEYNDKNKRMSEAQQREYVKNNSLRFLSLDEAFLALEGKWIKDKYSPFIVCASNGSAILCDFSFIGVRFGSDPGRFGDGCFGGVGVKKNVSKRTKVSFKSYGERVSFTATKKIPKRVKVKFWASSSPKHKRR